MKESFCEWSVNTWRSLKVSQQPEYEATDQLEDVLEKVGILLILVKGVTTGGQSS
jgi:hypothetical protein